MVKKDWFKLYSDLSSDDLDKIAVLRVMECTNGIIQYAHRDDADYKLSIEDTRRSMKFSMGCIKRMAIPLKEETLTFSPEAEELMREARDLYIQGQKHGDDEAYAEFMRISEATAQVCGLHRIFKGMKTLQKNIDDIPPDKVKWGVEYLMQFFSDEHIRDFLKSQGIGEGLT